MRRGRSVDVSLVVGAVLASVVFVTGLAAVSGVAAKATESPTTRGLSQDASSESAGHSGFYLEMDLHAGEVVPGGRVEYLVFYENLGAITESVSITDTMPLSSEFGSAWWGEGEQPNAGEPLTGTVVMDGELIWNLGLLEGGGARWFHVQVWLNPDLQAGQTITNTTEIAPASFETSRDDNRDIRVDVLNDFGPNLAVSKSHEWSLPGYEKLSYSVDFWNLGNILQTGVVIEDNLPVTTTYGGSWFSDFPDVILIDEEPGRLVWEVFNLAPGETGRIYFEALLDDPGEPLHFFTNTVEIVPLQGDVDPANNSYEDVAFSGNSITEVHLSAETMHSRVWGFAHAYDAITGTVQMEVGDQTLVTEWDLTCGGCWGFPDVGPIVAGDTITVTAGAGIPVVIEVPTPITATADSDTDEVWGQINHLDGESVEVELREVGTRMVTTDNNGNFVASFPDIPHGGQGEVRYATEINWAKVVFHRRIDNPDVVMNVNYAHDWVEGPYDVGHTVWITVTDSIGAVKATSQLETWWPPWWEGESGFTTQIDGAWLPEQPDIVPGDWVYVGADNGETAQLQVGVISGEPDYDADTVAGDISAPWFVDPLSVVCAVWEEGAPEAKNTTADPNGGPYFFDYSGEWDLQPEHMVAVWYVEPDNHVVINVFQEVPPQLEITKRGEGQPTTGGNFEYVVTFGNVGGGTAENTYITDTLPVGVSYLGNTSNYTVTLTVSDTHSIAVFDVGILAPEIEIDFSLFTQINAPITATITNTVEIAASNVVTTTLPGPSAWGNAIQPNDTDLTVVTIPSAQEPEPDSDLVWTVEVCNVGSTSSAAVVITDTIPASTPLTTWMVDQEGWVEVTLTPELLVAERPTVSGSSCSILNLTTHLPPDISPGEQLCNSVEVAAGNDINPANNSHGACVFVSGAAPAIEIQKATNGEDADDPPGLFIPVGDPVTWIYTITNSGNVTLTAVTAVDNQPGVNPDCPFDTLAPGEQGECTASGVAIEGQYENMGTATGTPPVGDPVNDTDPSHYFGTVAGLDIEKSTNGEDADDPPGPYVPVGEPVTWTYALANTGNVTVTSVTVVDDQPGVIPDCPFDTLGPGEQGECTASGVAVEGQYVNIGTATGSPPIGDPIGDSDPSHYFGPLVGLPFEDGFESGNTSAWSRVFP